MEEDNDDNTVDGGRGGSGTKSDKVDEMEEGAAKAKCDPENEHGGAEHSEKTDDNTGGDNEILSEVPPASNKKGEEMEENAAETKCDPENERGGAEHSEKIDDNTGGDSEILSEVPPESNKKDFEPSTGEDDEVEEVKERGQKRKRGGGNNTNISEWSAEENESMEDTSPSVFQQNQTVEEMLENAAEIKCDPENERGGAEHSEKIDDNTGGDSEILSEVPPESNKKDFEPSTGEDDDEVEEVKERGQKRKRGGGNNTNISEWSVEESESMEDTSPSVFQQNQTVEEMLENAAEIKCDPENERGGAEHSEKIDDNTGGDSEILSEVPPESNKKDFEPSTGEDDDEVEEVKERGQKRKRGGGNNTNISEWSVEESESMEDTSPSVFQQNQTVEEMLENAAEIKCDPENERGGAEHSEKIDDNTGGDSEILSEVPPESNKKDFEPSTGEGDDEVEEVKERGQKRKRGGGNNTNISEWSVEESESMEDTSPSVFQQNQTVEEMVENATETKCDRENERGGAEHSEKTDDNTGGDSEILSVVGENGASCHTGTIDMDVSGNKDKKSIEIDKRKQYQREFETLLGRLHLQEKPQQKFSPADFLKIGPSVKQDCETSEKDVAQTSLQRLMMLDYRARYIPVRQDCPKASHSTPDPVFDAVDSEDDDLDALLSSSEDFDQSRQTHVHPMDVQMALFHCSDSFLKQKMITKLSQCQYALPLLVPDPVTMDIECPLWTFRQIRKTWKEITEIKDDVNIVTMKSMPICKAETPMVSFVRLGSLSWSKSQLMNTLINERHSTFFHRNCSGSTKSRYLMDGVAEIAWYCPAGKPNDAFTDCIAFCNLHGDALSIEKQRNILTDKSSVNVVLVPTLEKGTKSTAVISGLLRSRKPLIILIAEKDHGAVRMKEGKYKMGLKDRSHSDVSEELKEIIKKDILSGPHSHASFQLETMAEVSGIRVDENDEVCQNGKFAATKIVNLFKGMDVSEIKDKFLPCQGQLWHKWCIINKELYHLKGHIEKEKCQKQNKLKQIRQDQCTVSYSKLMKLFIESLSSLPSTEREYFLKWTQILIDALSTDDLSAILQSYDEKWSEVLEMKKKHDKSELLKTKQTELDQISKKLQSATFGLEHIFREMGQIYEAHAFLQKQTKRGQSDWSKYPELAAELMISGQPMELMDGDAGHVPLTWISRLLDEVIKKLGDKRVFILSVLGVQSSGKSTMLNAMFGLQFAVSAGRCTKGAFMQLVKVSEDFKEIFQFDYVLVVDTEGLHALELEGNTTLHHDNELATFVVGLGNMTLINILGESAADMQDVLQIVVQAFMRMKKIKLSPSCVFVHQNITDIAAAERNMHGKRQLQEKLDQMAQLAAKEEVCAHECFSDIITFDVQKDVKYFAQLWEGSPPMAPPNPGYSESIQELKKIILSKASQCPRNTLSQFKSKIQDLWHALMNEHFVFSFKNTLEIAVYRKLEDQYCNWTWILRSNMLTIENDLYTEIENGKRDKVELSFLNDKMNETYGEVKKAMTTYFEDDRDKDMLVQWRGRFERKIQELHDEHVKGVKKKLDEVIQQKNACKKLDDKKTEFENKLLQKSKELAHELKDKTQDEGELERQFNAIWNGLVSELTADTKPIEDINYEEDQSIILQDLGIEWSLIAESRSSGKYKKISELGDFTHYVSLTKQVLSNTGQHSQDHERGQDRRAQRTRSSTVNRAWEYVSEKVTNIGNYFKGCFQYVDQEKIRSFIEDVKKQSLDDIKRNPVATRGYRSTYLQEVANNVKEKVTQFESESKYALKKEFTVDLLLYVFHKAWRWLSQSHKKFKGNTDAFTYVESKKTQYYKFFRSYCKGNSSAVVLGELICDKLKSSTVDAVCNKTAIDLTRQMKSSFPAFNGNRLNLEKHLLKSLAENEDFDGFTTYIRQPRSQVETFIRKEVQKYIFIDNKDITLSILKKNAEDIKTLVSQALFDATEKVKKKEEDEGEKGDPDMWVEEFFTSLKDVLTLDAICCQNFNDINNFDFLKEETEKGLVSIMEEISSLSLDSMEHFRMKPDEILIDQLCNCCWVKCPFCSAVCTNTLENHAPDKHNVPFHRPAGVSGCHYRGTQNLDVDFCTTLVASDKHFYHEYSDKSTPCKQYQSAGERFASWEITSDGSKLTYWKWFVCRFQKQLEKYYKLYFQELGEIPSEWRDHSKEEAIESLDDMYNL